MIKPEKRNLLLLTIDAWRADFIDTFAGTPLTPCLQAFNNNTLRFDRAYTTGPWTSPGIASIHTGSDAFEHRVWYSWSKPPPGRPALASLLRKAGYEIPHLCYKTAGAGCQNLGYDSKLTPGYPTGPDDSYLSEALGERPSQGGRAPWFAWHHYKYVHLPYCSTESHRRLFGADASRLPTHILDSVCSKAALPRSEYQFNGEDRAIVQALYAANVRQMDDFLGRVFQSLSASGQLEETTIVITSDHGDEHLEHNHIGHASTAHHATLYEEVLRVPLLIIDSRIHGPRCSQARVQLQDLMPTLLSLMGLPPPPLANAVDLSEIVRASMQGERNDPLPLPTAVGPHRLLRFHSSRMGYQTTRRHQGQKVSGFLKGDMKYICEDFDTRKHALYDLASDPGEHNPLTSGKAVDHAHKQLLALSANEPWITSAGEWSQALASRLMGHLRRSRQQAAALGRRS